MWHASHIYHLQHASHRWHMWLHFKFKLTYPFIFLSLFSPHFFLPTTTCPPLKPPFATPPLPPSQQKTHTSTLHHLFFSSHISVTISLSLSIVMTLFFLAKTFIIGHHHHLHFIFKGILNTSPYQFDVICV